MRLSVPASPLDVFLSLVQNPDDEKEIVEIRRSLREDVVLLHLFDTGYQQYLDDRYDRLCRYLQG